MKLTNTQQTLLNDLKAKGKLTTQGARKCDAALRLVSYGLAKELSRDFGSNWSITIEAV